MPTKKQITVFLLIIRLTITLVIFVFTTKSLLNNSYMHFASSTLLYFLMGYCIELSILANDFKASKYAVGWFAGFILGLIPDLFFIKYRLAYLLFCYFFAIALSVLQNISKIKKAC